MRKGTALRSVRRRFLRVTPYALRPKPRPSSVQSRGFLLPVQADVQRGYGVCEGADADEVHTGLRDGADRGFVHAAGSLGEGVSPTEHDGFACEAAVVWLSAA